MSKARILYIEDNLDNMILVKRVLEATGYEVINAETGAEGISIAEQLKPDLVITDINLPDIDGYEVTQRLKKSSKTASIPVVAMTANVMQQDREKVSRAGCDGYIAKPIDVDSLPDQVEHFIRGNKHV